MKNTYKILTNSDGWNEKPAKETDNFAPPVICPITNTTAKNATPAKQYTYVRFTIFLYFLIITGIISATTDATHTIRNCLMAFE